MTDVERRLADCLAAWCRSEIERGFLVHQRQSDTAYNESESGERYLHTTFCCGGVKPPGEAMTNWQSTMEGAARYLVSAVLAYRYVISTSLKTILWRALPMIDRDADEYVVRFNAYCRLSYVPADAAIIFPEA